MFPPFKNRPRPNDNEANSKVCANIWPTKRSKPHTSEKIYISRVNILYICLVIGNENVSFIKIYIRIDLSYGSSIQSRIIYRDYVLLYSKTFFEIVSETHLYVN